MARQQGKTHQPTKQVDEDEPFVLDVKKKTHHAFGFEASENDL